MRKIKNIAILQRLEDGDKWVEVLDILYDASKERFSYRTIGWND